MTVEGQVTGQTPPAEDRAAKIRVEGLSFHYGRFQALKDISLSVLDRRVTAFIGPSGCGKSTFLRALNRMNEVIEGTRTQGHVYLDGNDIYSPHIDVVSLRRRVGMVFQRPNPFPMSVFDNVAFGPRTHRLARGKDLEALVESALRRAALWEEVKDKLYDSAFSLSGGQQQRLCIARVLAVEPEVLLMDEPCSALDPTATFRIEELMLELMERYTIVIVTHNMYQASRVSQWAGFFLLGELIEYGPTARIFESPTDRRTDDYVRGRFG